MPIYEISKGGGIIWTSLLNGLEGSRTESIWAREIPVTCSSLFSYISMLLPPLRIIWTSSRLGGPRWYNSFRSSLISSPIEYSARRKGPVPLGS